MLKRFLWLRLLTKAQMQGGAPPAERGVLEARRSACRGATTPQMGLLQQPGASAELADLDAIHIVERLILTAHQPAEGVALRGRRAVNGPGG